MNGNQLTRGLVQVNRNDGIIMFSVPLHQTSLGKWTHRPLGFSLLPGWVSVFCKVRWLWERDPSVIIIHLVTTWDYHHRIGGSRCDNPAEVHRTMEKEWRLLKKGVQRMIRECPLLSLIVSSDFSLATMHRFSIVLHLPVYPSSESIVENLSSLSKYSMLNGPITLAPTSV